MPPDLKSSTTQRKPGQYTSTETDWRNRTPTPTYTVQDKTNTGQTCTGEQNKLKDTGTRISKIAKNTLTQTPLKANKSKCTLTKTGTKTNKHTHPNKDWGQYDQQKRPADPAEGTTVQPTKATIGTIDTLTQARTKEKGKTVTTRLRGQPHQPSPRYHWHTTDAGSNVCDERSGSA